MQSGPLPKPGRHRVIIPVYIPSSQGYFQQSMDVLSLCLRSLRLTVRDRATVTLIANGSALPVEEELRRQYETGWIDQLVINRANKGKVDAVVAAARGTFEELITIADADVLFMPGWIDAIETIFRCFPECGSASPSPNPRLCWYHTSATTLGALLKKELGHEKVVPETDLDRFAHSIGQLDLFDERHRAAQLVVRRNGAVACVGSGHFVFTIRREVLAGVPREPACIAIAKSSEQLWLDRPVDLLGLWRLATSRAYAYHMGNVSEAWMNEELEAKLVEKRELGGEDQSLPPVRIPWPSRIPWSVRIRLVSALRKMRVKEMADPRLPGNKMASDSGSSQTA